MTSDESPGVGDQEKDKRQSLEQSFAQNLRTDPAIPNVVILRDDASSIAHNSSSASNLGNVLGIGALLAATIFGGIAFGVQLAQNSTSSMFDTKFDEAIQPNTHLDEAQDAKILELERKVQELETLLSVTTD